jgi:hypothetical protein
MIQTSLFWQADLCALAEAMPVRAIIPSDEERRAEEAYERAAEQRAREKIEREKNELLGKPNPPSYAEATKPGQPDTSPKGETAKR